MHGPLTFWGQAAKQKCPLVFKQRLRIKKSQAWNCDTCSELIQNSKSICIAIYRIKIYKPTTACITCTNYNLADKTCCTVFSQPNTKEMRGPPLVIFVDVIPNHAESWLDSWFDSLWFLLPNKDLRYFVMRFYWCALKFTRIIVEILIFDSWFQNCIDSTTDSIWFLEASLWFGIMSGPSGRKNSSLATWDYILGAL